MSEKVCPFCAAAGFAPAFMALALADMSVEHRQYHAIEVAVREVPAALPEPTGEPS